MKTQPKQSQSTGDSKINRLDQFEVQGTKMKVEYQDNGKRRKDSK